MPLPKKKFYVSLTVGLLCIIAVIWLLFRACSAPETEENKIYYIGRDSTWTPLDLRGKEKNMVGFTDDLMQAIAQQQNFRAQLVEVSPNILMNGFNRRSYEGIFSPIAPNIINEAMFAFSEPFYLVGPVLVVRKGANVTSLKDMEGKIIGIERRTMQIYNIPEPANAVLIPYDSAAEALENLDNNSIDGVILEALRAYVATGGFYVGRLKVATSPLTEKGLRLVTLKDPRSLHLISMFNDGLKAVKDDGTYAQLLKKWDLIQTEREP